MIRVVIPLSPSFRKRLVALVLAALALGDFAGLRGQSPEASDASTVDVGDGFEKQSGALRTALHYDPSLGQPLRALVQLYEKADRTEELLGLYRAHLAEYPNDAGARVVLIRLLKLHNRAEVGEMIQSGVRLHPEEPMLHYLLYEGYRKADDSRALQTLSKAIELQTRADRRDIWLDELLELSRNDDDKTEAEKHLVALRDAAGKNAEALIAVAQRMHRYGLHSAALGTLKLARMAQPDPESGVEIEVLLAKTEAALGDRDAAGSRVDAVLKLVAADHWRRRELTSLRLQLAGSEAERAALLGEAQTRYQQAPEHAREAAALDYAGLLAVAGRRREAAELLVLTSTELPGSERLEKAALEMLERIADEDRLRKFLEQRVELQPERADLIYRLTKSQYLAGEKAAAEASLDAVLATLDPQEGFERLLDLARYLRKMGLQKPSAELLQRVVDAWPQRLDVRRELAETLLGLEQRPKAAELLRASDVEGAEIENLLDLVQFMIASKFHVEARDALKRRLALEPGQFELTLLMVEVLGLTGERQPGEALLGESRNLADTPARYRRWLSSGFAFHEIFDNAEMFFDREQFSFVDDAIEWDEDRVERFLALVEAGSEGKLNARVTQALRNHLAQPGLPVELGLRLRLLLVKALENSPEHAVEVEQHLRELAESDATRASEYALRRALLYHGAQRPDLAQELIAELDLSAIDEKGVLRAAYVMFLDYGAIDSAVDCVERLAVIDPADLVNYQRQLSLYAALGEEDALRRTLRRLLAGLEKIDFDSETLGALRGHLLDSYWRSISARINDQGAGSVVELGELLDAVERESLSGADRLWVLWTRAFLLNRSGQQQGRDEALAELEKAIDAARVEDGEASDLEIVFPDGLGTSLAAARVMLSESPSANPMAEAMASEGPLKALRLAWAFECDGDAQVIQIEPVPDAQTVLALDDNGVVYSIDAVSGKLRWRERFAVSTQSSARAVQPHATALGGQMANVARGGGASLNPRAEVVAASEIQIAPSLLTDSGGRFFLPVGDGIRCHAVDDGRLLWETDLSIGLGSPPWAATHDLRLARPNLELAIQDGHLVAYAPAIGVAAALAADSGKLVWLRTLGAQSVAANATVDGPVYSLNSGAAFGGDRMLVFGARSEILDTASGETLWNLGLGVPRRFPLRLRATAEDEEEQGAGTDDVADTGRPVAGGTALALGGAVSAGLRSASIDHRADRRARYAAAADFVQFTGSLLAPAAHWAQGRPAAGVPHDADIVGDDLLLLGQGMHRISLALPIGATHFQTEQPGEWIGVAGSSGWMLGDAELRRIDLDDGTETTYSLASVAGEAGIGAATLAGGRIYVTGDGGVLVINAFSGGTIAKLEWPDELVSYRQGRPGKWAEQVPARRVWQGGVYAWPGRPITSVADRLKLRVAGQRLYFPINGGSFVALEESTDDEAGTAAPQVSK